MGPRSLWWLAALCAGCISVDEDGDRSGFCDPIGGAVVINEVTSTGDDTIELFNGSASPLDLTGWSLADEDGDAILRYTLPDGTTLDSGALLVLSKPRDHLFGLGAADGLALSDAEGRQIDCVRWARDDARTSWCRLPDGVGDFQQCARSFGEANRLDEGPGPDVVAPDVAPPPVTGSLRLNELSSGSDRIELVNISTDAVDAAEWELSGAAGFHRLQAAVVPGGGRLVLFRSQHGMDLRSADTLVLRRPGGLEVERVTWCDGAAEPSYCRFPDFDGPFRPCGEASFGQVNQLAADGAPMVAVTTIAAADWFTSGPGPLTWDTQGRLWVADPAALTVRIFSGAGEPLGTMDQPVDARGLTAGPGGIMAVADGESGSVLLVGSKSLQVLSTLTFVEFDDPRGMAFGPDGELLIVENDAGGVLRVTTGGQVLSLWLPEAGPLPSPTSAAIDAPRARLFVALPAARRVEAFTLSGHHLPGSLGTEQLVGPIGGLATHPGAGLLLAADPAGARIHAWKLSQDLLGGAGYAGAFGRAGDGCVALDEPTHVAVSPDGSRVAVSDDDGRVQIYDGQDVRRALSLP